MTASGSARAGRPCAQRVKTGRITNMPKSRKPKIDASARLARSSLGLMRAGCIGEIRGGAGKEGCAILADRPMETIRIRGARTHNLRNVSVDIPREKLVVIT